MKKTLEALHFIISVVAVGLVIGAIIEVFKAGLIDAGVAMSLLLIGMIAQGWRLSKLLEELKKETKQ